MSGPRRVAVTGAGGRLGRAVVAELGQRAIEVSSWLRSDFDLDWPLSTGRLIERDRPDLVIHCAAWTDVDGCARDPELAMQRNATAVGELAKACAVAGIGMAFVSTNEVFDGDRTDGRGYREDAPANPNNPYGASKLAGEQQARQAFGNAGRLWIIRTAWLYGPPGNDFATKIITAADRLPAGDPLPVVADEIGSPTYSIDLARAIVALIEGAPPATYHLANSGVASRLDVASAVLDHCRPGVRTAPISRKQFVRASNPPAWAVLDGSSAANHGVVMRPWSDALEDYLSTIC